MVQVCGYKGKAGYRGNMFSITKVKASNTLCRISYKIKILEFKELRTKTFQVNLSHITSNELQVHLNVASC